MRYLFGISGHVEVTADSLDEAKSLLEGVCHVGKVGEGHGSVVVVAVPVPSHLIDQREDE